MMASEDKAQKDCHVDRLSSLPDDVLSQILSRLPTVNAVATSVLSKDWTYKWTLVYNIDILYNGFDPAKAGKGAMFVEFVERILAYIKNPRKLKFKLLQFNKRSLISSWISAFSPSNVEDLHIHVFERVNILEGPTGECFPNVKSMYLENLNICNGTSTLILTFPVLKEITLRKCYWGMAYVEIHAPTLNVFRSWNMMGIGNEYTIKIFADRLATFYYRGSLENFLLSGLSAISATLDSYPCLQDPFPITSGFHARIMLKDLSSSLEHLRLSLFLVQVIMDTKHISPPLPIFKKLRRLDIFKFGPRKDGNTQSLLEVLQAMPYLQILTIDANWNDNNYNYDQVESLPCMLLCLEEVGIESCMFNTNLNLTKFLLKTCLILKRLHYKILFCNRSHHEILEELSSYPRASTRLTITISVRGPD